MKTETLKQTMGKKDIVLFCISAILLLDTLAAGAAIGPSALFWWAFLGIIFFIPISLISAELGCTYPDQGGIYAWVKRAYGDKWASRMTWSYWVNTTVWCPALYILFAGMVKQLFWPEMGLWHQIGLGLALTWLSVWVNVVTLDVGKWVPNLGAVVKVIVFLSIIGGAYHYSLTNGMANSLTIETMTPNLADGFQYLPVIIYGMLGFELVSAGSDEIKNPKKNVPQGILISGVIIISFYLLATLAILAAVPVDQINLVEGLVDTLNRFFGHMPYGELIVVLLSVFTLYTFFSNGVTWSLGANRSTAEAAQDGELPAFFGLMSERTGTPIGAAITTGVLSSVILVLYGLLAGSNEELFWNLFAFSGVIFLIPYVGMVLAYIKLKDDGVARPFRVPGPLWVSKLMAYGCAIILVLTILLFNYDPGAGVLWPVFTGAALLLALGEFLLWISPANRKQKDI